MHELLGRTLTSTPCILQDAAISFGDFHFGRTSQQTKAVGMAASKGRELPLYHMTL